MSIQLELIRYLNTVRKDANDKHRIDNLKADMVVYKKVRVDENQVLSRKIAGFIYQLFQEMPEIAHADPLRKKLYPLYEYCENLPKVKKPTKKPRHSNG
jgi:hypothetical protein